MIWKNKCDHKLLGFVDQYVKMSMIFFFIKFKVNT